MGGRDRTFSFDCLFVGMLILVLIWRLDVTRMVGVGKLVAFNSQLSELAKGFNVLFFYGGCFPYARRTIWND